MRGITKPILKKREVEVQENTPAEDKFEGNGELQPRKTVRFQEEDFISGYQTTNTDPNNQTGSSLKPSIKPKGDKAFKIRHLAKVKNPKISKINEFRCQIYKAVTQLTTHKLLSAQI